MCARVWGCIAVDRGASGARTGPSVVEQLKERAAHAERNQCVVFPEGTTSNGRHLLKFRRGAFVPGAPVKPVIISYPHTWFDPAWESITGPAHLFRLLTQLINRCHLTFLPVYHPSPQEQLDPALFAENVRAYMSRLSGLPLINADLSDKQDYLQIIRGSKKLD